MCKGLGMLLKGIWYEYYMTLRCKITDIEKYRKEFDNSGMVRVAQLPYNKKEHVQTLKL